VTKDQVKALVSSWSVDLGPIPRLMSPLLQNIVGSRQSAERD
jgi:hypothetical protein